MASAEQQANILATAEIQGKLSIYNTNTLAGIYNLVVSPAASDPSQGPGGYGYGTATVSGKGAVALVLNLADGTSPTISFSSFVAQDGTCPFFSSLYGGKGAILGWMQFATDRSGTVSGPSVNWVKLPVADKFYTNGFMTTLPNISGAIYHPLSANYNVFLATGLTFTADAGYASYSLPNELDIAVVFDPVGDSFRYAANANRLSIKLTGNTGVLTGSFLGSAGSKTSFTYHGEVIGVGGLGVGFGFYNGANGETGPIWIWPQGNSSGEGGEGGGIGPGTITPPFSGEPPGTPAPSGT